MSLLSPDRLTLLVAPDSVQAIHTRGWRRKLMALERVAIEGVEADDWSAHTEACTKLLARLQPKSLHVIVSDRLVRYLVLAWNPELQNAQEELAMAHIEFEETYGEQSAQAWTFTISNEKPGVQRLVCAMPTALLESLKALSVEKKVALQSVQPGLVAVMQSKRKQLGKLGWFIHLDGGRLTMLHWDQGGCRWVATGRCAKYKLDSVIATLRREMLVAGGSSGAGAGAPQVPVYLVNPQLNATSIANAHGLQVTVLGQGARTLDKLRNAAALKISNEQALATFGTALLGAGL